MFGVWLLYFAFGTTLACMAPLVPIIEADIGINHVAMGTILGAWPVVYIASSAPCGALLDRFGPRPMLLLGTLVVAASAATRGLSDGYYGLLLAGIVFGLGGPLISSGAPKVISVWFSGKTRGLAVGIYFTGNALGSVTALSLTNSVMMPLFDRNWRNVMFCYAAFVVFSGLVWLLINLHPRRAGWKRNSLPSPRRRTFRCSWNSSDIPSSGLSCSWVFSSSSSITASTTGCRQFSKRPE